MVVQNQQNQGQQQTSRGAIILTWEQSSSPQASQTLTRNLRYFEQLQQAGQVQQYRVFMDLNGSRGIAILEGPIDNLIDLPKRTDHRNFLLVCQSTLPGFQATTAIGGANGDAEEVLRLVAQVSQPGQTVYSQTGMQGQPQQLGQTQQNQQSEYSSVGGSQQR